MIVTKYYCDSCEIEIQTQERADEYSQTNASKIGLDISIEGFVNSACGCGYFSDQQDILVCKKCRNSIIDSLKKFLPKLKGAKN